MARLSFCADEHVPQAVVGALRSNGFEIVSAAEHHGQETVDSDLLTSCADDSRVLITNDRDFVSLGHDREHAGIVIYTDQSCSPADFARGIRRIDRQFTPDAMQNTIAWVDEWW